MRHRLALVPAALLLVLTLAAPAQAKGDVQARLDAPIPGDAAAGTTLVVGWTATQADGDGGTVAFTGAPVFIALTAPGAAEAEALVIGDEFPAGSGHYTASIVVPPGGIAPDGVSIGLRGTSCEAGVCQRSDLLFELVGEVLAPVSHAARVAPVAAMATPPTVGPAVGAPADPAAAPSATDAPTMVPATLGVAGVVIAALVIVIAAVVGRRRGPRVATD